MHRSKKSFTKKLLLIVSVAVIGFGIQQASAATIGTTKTQTSSAWQQLYQSIYSKVATVLNKTSLSANTLSQKTASTNIKNWKSAGQSTPAPKTISAPAPSPSPTPISAPTPTVSSTPAPAPVSAPTPVSSSKSWGAYTGNTATSFTSFEQEVGKQANISAIFLGWGDSIPSDIASLLKTNNQTLIIFWEPNGISLSSITSGSQDSVIQQFAANAKLYGGPIILIPGEEINGNWDIWDGAYGSNTPSQAVAAYKHVHDVFASASAANVKFGWDINSNSVPDTSANAIANYWPGASYVDYVCIDGFNFGNPWETYSDIFSSPLSQVRGYGKPIIIASMASAEGPQKAAWITDALSKINSDSSITGWVWFNENKEQNWLVNSDQAALTAFENGIK